MNRRRVFVTLLAVMACCVALAAQPWVDLQKRLTPEQMHATGLDTLTTEQLALLNRLLREEAVAEARARPAPTNDAKPDDSDSSIARFLGKDDGIITSRLVGSLSGWEPGTEFELANGQRWKVLKGHFKLRKTLVSPEVRVVPGAAGRWFFRVDDDTPGARVYRID